MAANWRGILHEVMRPLGAASLSAPAASRAASAFQSLILRLVEPFGLLPSLDDGESGARSRLASRISSEDALHSVATSLWQIDNAILVCERCNVINSELIRWTLHLEILRHERYCIYTQPRIATIFPPLLRAKTGLNPYEWAVFSVWPGHSHIHVLARHRRVRRAGPTRLPDFIRCHIL
jgi:hypothetical protein